MNARLLGAAALLGALAVPSAAVADTTIVAGPMKVKGYDMTVIATDAGKNDLLSILLAKTVGKSMQQHMYSFDAGLDVTPTKLDADLGAFGSIDMTMTGAKSGRIAVPKGCTGSPSNTKKGTLAGSLRFVADSTYFKTITAKRLKGSSLEAKGPLECKGPAGKGKGGKGGDAGGVTMTLSGDVPAGMLSFTAGTGLQTAMVMEDDAKTAPASIVRMITVEGARKAFTAAGDLSTATVKGTRPFLSGTGAFEGQASGTSATGTLRGDLAARFDAIGTVSLTGDDLVASLFKR